MHDSARMVNLGFDATPYPANTHMCFIFNDDDERRRVLAQFTRTGLADHEQVSYFVDTLPPEELKQVMRELGAELPDELEGQQYVFEDAGKVYCPDGCFKVQRMIDTLAGCYHRSQRDGYAGSRLTGEMSWALKGYPGSEDLVEYEARINLLLREVPSTIICQYDARLFDGATLYGILSVHPMMIVHGQVVRNPYYIEPEVFLAGRHLHA
ncbi:hypothetical protein JCM19379_10130 [Methyloparacoccus murrellii]